MVRTLQSGLGDRWSGRLCCAADRGRRQLIVHSESRPRRVLLVGDNRTSNNWGGRGAGIALCELLSREYEVSGTVPGNYFTLGAAGFGYINTLIPAKHYWVFEHFLLARRKRWLFDWYVRLEELFGAKDFIRDEPKQTAENILAHRMRYEKLGELYRLVSECDAVIVNGEGDCVLTDPPRREMLFMLGLAELGFRLGKPVVFANMILGDATDVDPRSLSALRERARQVFRRCEVVLVRETRSLEYLKREMPEVETACVPDSLFTLSRIYDAADFELPARGDFLLPYPDERDCWGKLDFGRPYVCVGGGALGASDPARAKESYVHLLESLKRLGLPVYVTENDGRDRFLREAAAVTGVGVVPVTTPVLMAGSVLARARLFVSGRYHPTILASLGGTPCIFLESVAGKTASLQRLLEYEETSVFTAWPSDTECDKICELAGSYLQRGEALRVRITGISKKLCREAERLPELIGERLARVEHRRMALTG